MMNPIAVMCAVLLMAAPAAAQPYAEAPDATVYFAGNTSRRVKGLQLDGVFWKGADTGTKFQEGVRKDVRLGLAGRKGQVWIPISQVMRISFALADEKSERGFPVYNVAILLRAAKGEKAKTIQGQMALGSLTGDRDPAQFSKFWHLELKPAQNRERLKAIAY